MKKSMLYFWLCVLLGTLHNYYAMVDTEKLPSTKANANIDYNFFLDRKIEHKDRMTRLKIALSNLSRITDEDRFIYSRFRYAMYSYDQEVLIPIGKKSSGIILTYYEHAMIAYLNKDRNEGDRYIKAANDTQQKLLKRIQEI